MISHYKLHLEKDKDYFISVAHPWIKSEER